MDRNVLCSCVLLPWLAGCAAAPPPRSAAWRQPFVREALAPAGTQSLRGLAVVDADVAWVGGRAGALYRTVDGGRSWQHVAPPGTEGCDFRDLEAFDRDTAVAMVAGTPAQLWRTADGGASWQLVLHDPRPGAFFDGIAFAGAGGVLFGDPLDGAFCVWTSADAGCTWQPVPAGDLPAPLPGEAAFAASGTCVAAGGAAADALWIATGGAERARLLRGSHTGSWSATDLPLRAGDAARGAFSVAVRGAAVLVVGGDYRVPWRSDGSASRSADGGATAVAVAGGCGGFRSAVVWLDDERAIAVGSHGASWSADRGASWHLLEVGGAHAIARGADGSLWCCGERGEVARLVPTR